MISVKPEACWKHPCQNGGSCVQRDDRIACQCSEGWHGEMCQISKLLRMVFERCPQIRLERCIFLVPKSRLIENVTFLG